MLIGYAQVSTSDQTHTEGPEACRSKRRACSSSRLIAANSSVCPSLTHPTSRPQWCGQNLQLHRIRVAVLTAMREREARRIAEAVGRSMRDFRDHGQGANRPRADAGDEQEFREIGWAACGCCRQITVQATRDDVTGANVVMVRHYQVGQHWLGRRLRRPSTSLQPGEFQLDPVWAKRAEERVHDQAPLDRPGNADIQLDIFYDYRTNLPLNGCIPTSATCPTLSLNPRHRALRLGRQGRRNDPPDPRFPRAEADE